MEQEPGSILDKEYAKALYGHHLLLSKSRERPGYIKHKLESRL